MKTGFEIIKLEETRSTNLYLKELCRAGKVKDKKVLVIAKRQTGGRGRLGRVFFSPEGGLYMSLVLPGSENLCVTAKAAVAVLRAVKKIYGLSLDVKWVNDIFFNGGKLAGILAEYCAGYIVLGIGLNAMTPASVLNENIDVRTSVLSAYVKTAEDIENLAVEIARQLYNLCEIEDRFWLDEYRKADIITGKEVDVIQAGAVVFSGTAEYTDEECHLHVVDKEGNEMIISTGEVSIRKRQD